MIISFSSTVLGLVQKNPYIRKVLGRCSKAQMGELTGSRCLFPALRCSTFAIVGELLAVPSNTNTAELLLDEFQPSASRQRGSLDCCVLFCIDGEQVCHFMLLEWWGGRVCSASGRTEKGSFFLLQELLCQHGGSDSSVISVCW